MVHPQVDNDACVQLANSLLLSKRTSRSYNSNESKKPNNQQSQKHSE